MAYGAKIPATLTIPKVGSGSLVKKINFIVPINQWLIEFMLTNGELTPVEAGSEEQWWTYSVPSDEIGLSVGEFWPSITEALHMNFASMYENFYTLDNPVLKETSIYKWLKAGGANWVNTGENNTPVNRDFSIVSDEKTRTIGTGELYTNGQYPNDFRVEPAIQGRILGTRYDSDAEMYIEYRCGYDLQLKPYNTFTIIFYCFGEDWVKSETTSKGRTQYKIDSLAGLGPTICKVVMTGNFAGVGGTNTDLEKIKVDLTLGTMSQLFKSTYAPIDGLHVSSYEDDGDVFNPYKPGTTRPTDGGDGDFDDSSEKVELTPIPEISAINCGMFTAYDCTLSQLDQLANYLYSDSFNLDQVKKLWSSPMQSIVGLGVIPVAPQQGITKEVKFGGVPTGISMATINNQFKEVDCGSVTINKYWGNFADYDPYTQIDIYLPFIGTRQLAAADCMGRTLSLIYRIDVLTGACVAIINVSGLGPIYSFTGSCMANMPFSANDYSTAIGNGIAAMGSIVATGWGAATGNAVAVGAGLSSLANTAASSINQSQINVSHSGNVAGTAGFIAHRNAFVTISRPKQAVPNQVNKLVGIAASYSDILGNLTGFTMVSDIHLENIPATDAEKAEIDSLLKSGVIL